MDWLYWLKAVLMAVSALFGLLFIVSWATSGIAHALGRIADELRGIREMQAEQFAELRRDRRQQRAPEQAKPHPIDNSGMTADAFELLSRLQNAPGRRGIL
jgi:hypothetical protein